MSRPPSMCVTPLNPNKSRTAMYTLCWAGFGAATSGLPRQLRLVFRALHHPFLLFLCNDLESNLPSLARLGLAWFGGRWWEFTHAHCVHGDVNARWDVGVGCQRMAPSRPRNICVTPLNSNSADGALVLPPLPPSFPLFLLNLTKVRDQALHIF